MNRVILNPLFLEYFKDYNYFKNIINTLQKIGLSKIEESYLRLFISYPLASAYDITHNEKMQAEIGHDKLNDNDNAYRRAKIILRKLEDLKLIDLPKEKEKNPRNKKSCFLTDIGLFYFIKSPTFLSIDIQAMIRNYPKFKIFKDLLYPFITLDTLCSENIPIDILHAISLYIQKYFSNIENFISYAINKNNWEDEIEWNWNTEKLRKYLIDKYKYIWLENAETKESYDSIILRFFNKNKHNEYIDIRLREDKTSEYLINGTKKKRQKIIIPNIETFLIKFHLSKEEKIGRSFSNYYTMRDSKFLFSLFSASTSYTFDISVLFSKDKKFIRALEAAKEEFDKLYLSIKNPHQYSLESLIAKDLWELAYKRNKDDEQNNKDEEQKQTSEKPKLKDTRGIYLGNHYADKSDTGHNSINNSNTCIYCPQCKKSFNSNFKFRIHIPQCNK